MMTGKIISHRRNEVKLYCFSLLRALRWSPGFNKYKRTFKTSVSNYNTRYVVPRCHQDLINALLLY